MKNIVSIVKSKNNSYPSKPFNPPKNYPEFPKQETDPKNDVYNAVRETLHYLGFDKENYGTKKWNPFKDLIKEGDNVVIKPNLVLDRHPLGLKGVNSMIAHASVIRPLIDYVLLASKCKITICDVPLQSAVWDRLIRANGLKDLVDFYKQKGINISLLDLRYEIAIQNKEGINYKSIKKIRDPLGYAVVNLGKKSYLQGIIKDYKKLEITDYGIGTVGKHHNPKKNEYLVPKTILNADVFINVPKLKCHRKAGVTLSMKNLIGINGDKSWIAHHRRGVDEYPKFKLKAFLKWKFAYYLKAYAPKWLVTIVYKLHRKIFLKGMNRKSYGFKHDSGMIMEGDWYGNDTLWRTILDLNNIIFFADKEGKMMKKQQRKYLTIIDGIIGMEREAPMGGTPKESKLIIGGFHPVAVDYIASHLMGFDYKKIHKIREGFRERFFGLTPFSPEDVKVNGNVDFKKTNLKFIPTKGWKGHIER